MKKIIVGLLLILTLGACSFINNAFNQPQLDRVVKIYIRPSGNLTNQFGIDMELMLAFANEIQRDGRLTFVNSRSEADAVVSLSIVSYDNEPLTYDANMNVEQYKLSVILKATLANASDNQLIWVKNRITVMQIYRGVASIEGGLSNQSQARAAVWEKASRNIIKDLVKFYLTPEDDQVEIMPDQQEEYERELEE
jgi:hypothetical protein